MQARPREQKYSFLDYLNEDYLRILAKEIEKHLSAYSESTDDWLHQKDHRQAKKELEAIHALAIKRIDLTTLKQVAVMRLEQLEKLAQPFLKAENEDSFSSSHAKVKDPLKEISETLEATYNLPHEADADEREQLKASVAEIINKLSTAKNKDDIAQTIESIAHLQLNVTKSRHDDLCKLHKSLLQELNKFLNEKHKRNEHIDRLQRLLVATIKQYQEVHYHKDEYDSALISSKLNNLDLMATALSHTDIAFAKKWHLSDGTDDCASNPGRYTDWKAFIGALKQCDDIHYHARIVHDTTERFGIPETRQYRLNSSLIRRVNKADEPETIAGNKKASQTFKTLTNGEINALIDKDKYTLKYLAEEVKKLHMQHDEIVIWTQRNLQIALTEVAARAIKAQLTTPDPKRSVTSIINDVSETYKTVLGKVHAVQFHISSSMQNIKNALELKGIPTDRLRHGANLFEPSYGQTATFSSGHLVRKTKSKPDFEDELEQSDQAFKKSLYQTLALFTCAEQVTAFAQLMPQYYGHDENNGIHFPANVIEDICNNVDIEPTLEDKPLAGQPDWQNVEIHLHNAAIGKQKEESEEFDASHNPSEEELLLGSPPRSASEDFAYGQQVTNAMLQHARQQPSWGERHPVAKKVLVGLAIGGGIALLSAGIAAAIIFSGGTVAAAGAAGAAGAGIAAKLGVGGIAGIFSGIMGSGLIGGTIGGWVVSIANRDHIANQGYELVGPNQNDSFDSTTSELASALRKPRSRRPSRSSSLTVVLDSSKEDRLEPPAIQRAASLTEFGTFASQKTDNSQAKEQDERTELRNSH